MKSNKASTELNWHALAARRWPVTLTSGPNRAADHHHYALLAIADVVTAARVTVAVVTAIEAAGAAAVRDAADVIDMGCSKSLHCAIQHV